MDLIFPRVIIESHPPGANDDASKGIVLGQPWVANEKYYICVNNSEGGAKWIEQTLEGVTASFSATPSSGEVPLTVNFINSSSATGVLIDSYLWEFGDGTTSTQESPSHIFSNTGNYTVELTVTSNAGFTDSITKEIGVYEQITVDFSADKTTAIPGETINFNNTSSGTINSYLWDFADGNTSNQENPSHTYTEQNIYNVSLTVSNNYQSKSKTTTITILYPEWQPNTNYNNGDILRYNSVLIQANTDHTSGSEFNSSYYDLQSTNTWQSNTDYNVGDTVEHNGSQYVCTESHTSGSSFDSTKFDDIDFWQPNTNYNSGDHFIQDGQVYTVDSAFTSGSNFDSSNATLLSKQWQPNTFYSNGESVTYNGTSYVSNQDHNSESTFDSSKYNSFDPNIDASFSMDTTTGDAPLTVNFTNNSTGSIDSYSWDFGDGNTSNQENPSYTYNSSGSYTPTLTVSNQAVSDSYTANTTIVVNEPPDPQIQNTSLTYSSVDVTNWSSGTWTLPSGWSATKIYSDTGLKVTHGIGTNPVNWFGVNRGVSPEAFVVHNDIRTMNLLDSNNAEFTQIGVSDTFLINLIFDSLGSGNSMKKYVITVNDWASSNFVAPQLFTLSKINSDTGLSINHGLNKKPMHWTTEGFSPDPIKNLLINDLNNVQVNSLSSISTPFTINLFFAE